MLKNQPTLENLGANALFNPKHLGEEDKLGIEQTLSDSKSDGSPLIQAF
jgi:hypothetical protein